MTLDVAIRHRFGRFTLDVTFAAGEGFTAVLGPSGAGKTSILNVVAGLLRPQHGLVTLGDDPLVDTARDIWIPPHRRRVGYVSQEPRLFPHFNVRHNLLFGRWFAHPSSQRVSFEEVVELFDLATLLTRRPARLSGGEKQRVALGRALLTSPRLLLLDEPLASVDEGRKQDILPYLDRLRTEMHIPIVYVTHVVSEIADRADRVVRLDHGRVVLS